MSRRPKRFRADHVRGAACLGPGSDLFGGRARHAEGGKLARATEDSQGAAKSGYQDTPPSRAKLEQQSPEFTRVYLLEAANDLSFDASIAA
jgi:hypothetical protein